MIEHARSPEARSPARDFRPRPMRLSILTAALQELTPRNRRDADPDMAIEEWMEFARELRCPSIELSAALHPTASDVPAAHPAGAGPCNPRALPCRTSPTSTTCSPQMNPCAERSTS